MALYPAENTNVAVAHRDGTVKIYGHLESDEMTRSFIRKLHKNTYANARLYAEEYESLQRQPIRLKA